MSCCFAILPVPLPLLSAAPADAAVRPLPVGPDVDYQLGGFRWTCDRYGAGLPVVLSSGR